MDQMINDRLSRVRCFLLDMDGTFYLGNQLIDGALKFINTIQAQGRDYLFLTNNSSKHRSDYAEKFSRLGLNIPETKIFTSGEATARYLLQSYPRAKLFVVGTPSLEEEFLQHGFELSSDSPDIAVLGFDTTLTYEKLLNLCNFVRMNLPYIATHPDFNCPTDEGFMPDIGAMIAFVKASTGRDPDIVIGKPNRPMIDAISEKLQLSLDDMAMVGDRLYTDIALGTTTGLTTILVLSGETKLEDLDGSPYQPDFIYPDIGALADTLKEFERQG
jgi:4-nitrophenyl phosphatase